MSNAKTGIFVLSMMGLLWWVIGAFSLLPPWRYVVMAAGLLAALAMIGLGARRTGEMRKLDGRIFFLSVSFEAFGVALAWWACAKTSHPGFILPAVAVIVGLHFIGMWKASDRKDYLLLAAILCVMGLAVLALPTPLRFQILGIGIALVLWGWAAHGIAALERRSNI